MDAIKTEKELVWIQILYLYVVPTLLIYFGVIPGNFRIILLLGISLLMYGIIKRSNWTYKDMGISIDFMKDIFPYAIFTVISVISLIFISQIVTVKPMYEWWEDARFLLLFIPISFLQEIIFRGILMHLLKKAFSSPVFIIVLNASVFMLIHIIYINTSIILPLTFIAGLGFAWIYYKYPNLILVSISHAILNFTAMILGFFVLR